MGNSPLEKSWLFHIVSNAKSAINLFCFPYAGSSALYYREWQRYFDDSIQICPVEIPGRGLRYNEFVVSDITRLVGSIARDILPYMNKRYALFGHSMGALIAYELAVLFEKEAGRIPEFLFVSGCRAPHRREPEIPVHSLPEHEFVEKIREFNGTPPEVLENNELMELYIPILKADFALCENYSYLEHNPLSCPIIAFAGKEDEEVPESSVKSWHRHTKKHFENYSFSGDHFFIHRQSKLIAEVIQKKLLKV